MTQDYYGTKRVTAWSEKHRGPNYDEMDGYAVKYADGYQSWSPKDVFEAAYQPITAMSFSGALQALKDDHCLARAGWNGKGMWIRLTGRTEIDSVVGTLKDFIYMKTVDGELVPWVASQTDLLADDWMIVV